MMLWILILMGFAIGGTIIGGILWLAFTEECPCGRRGFHFGGGECGR